MKDFILFIARQLVSEPDAVTVTEVGEQDGVMVYNLSVADDDKGFIIGKHGRVAKSIRQIAKVAAAKEGKKISIDII
jgi:predicted RNA-binding protein YlqC (UPF0109 family)